MALTPRFDPADLALQEDPYPRYSALRAAGRTVRAGPGQIAASHYADVSALLRSPRLSNQFPEEYRNFSIGAGPASEFLRRILLHRDPPAHTDLRRMLGAPLVRSRLPALAEQIKAIVHSLLDEALALPAFDAVTMLALPLPILVICEILGVPPADAVEIRRHASALSLAFKLKTTANERSCVDRSVLFLRDYLVKLLLGDASAERSTLMEAARAAQRSGTDLADIIDNLMFIFFAGFETTASLITTGSNLLAVHPHLLEQLRDDDAMTEAFIDEVLRFDAPIQSRARLVVEPIAIGERTINAGRVVLLLIGSANRDPEAFAEADRFDIARRSPPHLSFGAGAHYCLGAQLARIEAKALFSCLASRCRRLQYAAPPLRDMSSVFRCYSSVPLRPMA